jgi:hypothetical protein
MPTRQLRELEVDRIIHREVCIRRPSAASPRPDQRSHARVVVELAAVVARAVETALPPVDAQRQG